MECGDADFLKPFFAPFWNRLGERQHHKEDKASVAEASPIPIGLAAPTRVSPAPAAEQKQNQENNQ
jgi:hypothetical protein